MAMVLKGSKEGLKKKGGGGGIYIMDKTSRSGGGGHFEDLKAYLNEKEMNQTRKKIKGKEL